MKTLNLHVHVVLLCFNIGMHSSLHIISKKNTLAVLLILKTPKH